MREGQCVLHSEGDGQMSISCASETTCSSVDYSSPRYLPSSHFPQEGRSTGILEKVFTEHVWKSGSTRHCSKHRGMAEVLLQGGTHYPAGEDRRQTASRSQLLQDGLQLQNKTTVLPLPVTEGSRGRKAWPLGLHVEYLMGNIPSRVCHWTA